MSDQPAKRSASEVKNSVNAAGGHLPRSRDTVRKKRANGTSQSALSEAPKMGSVPACPTGDRFEAD